MVENLLSITRVGSDKAEIKKQMEAPEEIIGAVVSKFRKRYPDVKFSVRVPDEFLMVPMDAILIEQVISNLLENAVIHGETTSEIKLKVENAGQHVQFSVQDNGVGIPAAQMERLFDGTMKQNETAKGDIKRNMGIGLSVCMAIVHAHGGTLSVRNLEQGAEFIFTLPLNEEND